MAIAIALIGFNVLGRDPYSYFSFQIQIIFTIISTMSKNEQKTNVGSSNRKFKISVHGTWNPATLWLQGA